MYKVVTGYPTHRYVSRVWPYELVDRPAIVIVLFYADRDCENLLEVRDFDELSLEDQNDVLETAFDPCKLLPAVGRANRVA